MTLITDHPGGCTISIRVVPNAPRTALAVNQARDRLVVKVTSTPREGKANQELLRLLGKVLGVPPTSLKIIRGASSRDKLVLLPERDVQGLRKRLQERLAERS